MTTWNKSWFRDWFLSVLFLPMYFVYVWEHFRVEVFHICTFAFKFLKVAYFKMSLFLALKITSQSYDKVWCTVFLKMLKDKITGLTVPLCVPYISSKHLRSVLCYESTGSLPRANSGTKVTLFHTPFLTWVNIHLVPKLEIYSCS